LPDNPTNKADPRATEEKKLRMVGAPYDLVVDNHYVYADPLLKIRLRSAFWTSARLLSLH
jgi:hypothetical protein